MEMLNVTGVLEDVGISVRFIQSSVEDRLGESDVHIVKSPPKHPVGTTEHAERLCVHAVELNAEAIVKSLDSAVVNCGLSASV